MFRKLLDVNPKHAAGIQQLARVLVDIFKDGVSLPGLVLKYLNERYRE